MKQKFEMLNMDTVSKTEIEYSNPQDIIKLANKISDYSEDLKEFIKSPLLKISKTLIDTAMSNNKPFVLSYKELPEFGSYRKDRGIYWNFGIFEGKIPQNRYELLSSFLYCAGLNLSAQKKNIYETEIFHIGNVWASILFVYFGYEYGIKLDNLKIESFSALIKLFVYYNYTKKTDLQNYYYYIIAKSEFKDLKANSLKFDIYDFSSVDNFLKCLQKNKLTDALDLGRFASKLSSGIGIMGIKAFEYYEYFVPWIMAATLHNRYVSSNLFKNTKDSFNNLVEVYFTSVSRLQLNDVITATTIIGPKN